MDIYAARWQNAKRIAEKIIDLQNKGYLIFDEDSRVVDKFEIEENRIVEKMDGATIVHFVNDNNYDEGLYITIPEFNKRFKSWKCVDPKNIIPLE